MASQPVPPAERIRELSAINADASSLLQSAGQAINALTNRPLNPPDEEDTQMTDTSTIESHREAFQDNTRVYLETLQTVFARLRRQAYALEEAGIITAEPEHEEKFKNGGLGSFDVGWLNSRGNKVGEEKEAELVKEARELLEEVLEKGKG